MATAALGFCVSQLTASGHSSLPEWFRYAVKVAMILLCISIAAGVICTLVRVRLFKRRRDDPRYETSTLVFWLYMFQFLAFGFGILFVGVPVLVAY